MLDKLTSLSFSMYSNRGVYALFLGSGISSAAGIPTAWDIVKDLTRRIAITQGESDISDPIKWYIDKYHDEPDYSDLLSKLVHTSTERKELLLPYFMPNEDNDKKPTLAHRSIAKLIKDGFIKVVITTNFDRLLETALNDISVPYQVIQHETEISGATPIVHSNCTILKINGDYLDCRFKNTLEELSQYSEELSIFLKEIFRDFGLITCGWSATWDKAIVQLMKSCANKRYFSFFTYRDKCSDTLQELASFKSAETIDIADADTFFSQLYESVSALNGIDRNIPLSKEIVLARLKKYIQLDRTGLINYNDLIEQEFEYATRQLESLVFSQQQPTKQLFDLALDNAVRSIEVIVPITINVIRWGNQKHLEILFDLLKNFFDRKVNYPLGTVYRESRDLNFIAQAILFYVTGISCVIYKRYRFLNNILLIELKNQSGGNHVFNSYIVDSFNDWLISKQLINENLYNPFSIRLLHDLRNLYFPKLDENVFESFFCIFEYLLALYYGYLSQSNLNDTINAIPIAVCNNREMLYISNIKKDFDKFFNDISSHQSNSEVIKQGMFNGDFNFYLSLKQKVDSFINEHPRGY